MLQHCDRVMTRQYAGERTVVLAQILKDKVKVKVYSNDSTSLHIKFDRMPTQVNKEIAIS